MKKLVCAVQCRRRWAKGRLFRTFTLTWFFLFFFILPGKFTMKGGEESVESGKSPQELVPKHISTELLTLPEIIKLGEKK